MEYRATNMCSIKPLFASMERGSGIAEALEHTQQRQAPASIGSCAALVAVSGKQAPARATGAKERLWMGQGPRAFSAARWRAVPYPLC